jgi:hypothetical protein
METEPRVALDALALPDARLESCVAAIVGNTFPVQPTLWDELAWAGRYALGAGLILAVTACLFGTMRRAPPPTPPSHGPAYAPFPDDALLTLGTRGDMDAP